MWKKPAPNSLKWTVTEETRPENKTSQNEILEQEREKKEERRGKRGPPKPGELRRTTKRWGEKRGKKDKIWSKKRDGSRSAKQERLRGVPTKT